MIQAVDGHVVGIYINVGQGKETVMQMLTVWEVWSVGIIIVILDFIGILTVVNRPKSLSKRKIVPTARHGQSQGENGNVDQFLMPRDSFTFRGRNEEGRLSNRAEHLSARAKQGKTAQRS